MFNSMINQFSRVETKRSTTFDDLAMHEKIKRLKVPVTDQNRLVI